jgi:hypothetical protein
MNVIGLYRDSCDSSTPIASYNTNFPLKYFTLQICLRNEGHVVDEVYNI